MACARSNKQLDQRGWLTSVRVLAMLFVTAFPAVCLAQVGTFCNVKRYGAVGDGVTLNTSALSKAVEACARPGGGTVYVPAGTYLMGTVNLKSNMTLWLASGATLLGNKNLADYRVGEPLEQKDDALWKVAWLAALSGTRRWFGVKTSKTSPYKGRARLTETTFSTRMVKRAFAVLTG